MAVETRSYFKEVGVASDTPSTVSPRAAFDSAACDLIAELQPAVVSFHFGLPEGELLARVKATGAKILSSATSVDEARWLEDQGCDAIIAQGFEAGGHRGTFLTDEVFTQVGTMALVPQIVDSVRIPVIAAGGIADPRGIVAALSLGATSADRHGISILPRIEDKPLVSAGAARRNRQPHCVDECVYPARPARAIVNRLVREVGPISDSVPEFPTAAAALAPLRSKSESSGSTDFSRIVVWPSGAPLSRTARTRANKMARSRILEQVELTLSLQ